MGAAALVVGLLVGIAVGRSGGSGSGPGEQALPQSAGGVEDPPSSTTTTTAGISESCVETIRSAQQALVLLDEGLQSLSDLELGAVEDVLADMERLRAGFSDKVQECLDDPQLAPDG